MQREKSKTDKEELKKNKTKYNESEIIKKYLKSPSGIPFLMNCYESNKSLTNTSQDYNLFEQVDELIDFYTTWTRNFPVRKNLKVSKYEFLKKVEEYCSKKEVNDELTALFK